MDYEDGFIEFDLLKKVVDQIKEDADFGDYTTIEELLKDIPEEKLQGFLPESEEEEDG